jgi:hypothetical protein
MIEKTVGMKTVVKKIQSNRRKKECEGGLIGILGRTLSVRAPNDRFIGKGVCADRDLGQILDLK